MTYNSSTPTTQAQRILMQMTSTNHHNKTRPPTTGNKIYHLTKGHGKTEPARTTKPNTLPTSRDLRHFYQAYEGSRKHSSINLLINELIMLIADAGACA
jgi:hypothetical protein